MVMDGSFSPPIKRKEKKKQRDKKSYDKDHLLSGSLHAS
jgi:hypothetical protein